MAKFKRIGMGLSSNDVICTRKSVFYIQVQLELQKPQMTIQFHIDITCNQKLCQILGHYDNICCQTKTPTRLECKI